VGILFRELGQGQSDLEGPHTSLSLFSAVTLQARRNGGNLLPKEKYLLTLAVRMKVSSY